MAGELETPKVPSPKPDDPEDVSWALSTAEAMWSRGEHVDAIKWIRRGAEAASEADADQRALELAKAAADLSTLIARAETKAAEQTLDVSRTVQNPHAKTLVSQGNASTRPPESMTSEPPPVLPSPSMVRQSTTPRPATSPPRAPSTPPPKPSAPPPAAPVRERAAAPRPLQVASPAMPIHGRGVLSPRTEARRRRSSGDFGQHVAQVAQVAQVALGRAAVQASPLAHSTAIVNAPSPAMDPLEKLAKGDRSTPTSGMSVHTLRDGHGHLEPAPVEAAPSSVTSREVEASGAKITEAITGPPANLPSFNANATMELPAISMDPETILRRSNLASAVTAPPGGWEEHPTQSMNEPFDDHATMIGQVQGYRQEAALPPIAPPNQARLVTSQAVRVIMWRDAAGVHIAPHGTVVSAITVDAIVVAMDPGVDLAAWLEWKLGGR